MKSKLYSLLQEGILKKPRKALVTYRSLIEPVNADTTIGQFTLYGVISNDDPTIALSDTINLYPSIDADHPYRTITVDLSPMKEITNVFYTLINPNNAFNLNCIINHIELISDQGNIPIGLGILEPEALAATLIATTGFTANWTEVEEATGYKIDISTDIEFGSFVGSYENYDIPSGTTVSLVVAGITMNICYFYRVRAYNTTFTSLNSNIAHVELESELVGTYGAVYRVVDPTVNFTDDGLIFTRVGATDTNYARTYSNIPSLPTKFTIACKFNNNGVTRLNTPATGLWTHEITNLSHEFSCQTPTGNPTKLSFIMHMHLAQAVLSTYIAPYFYNGTTTYQSIVLVYDSTLTTGTDRVKIFCDGVYTDRSYKGSGTLWPPLNFEYDLDTLPQFVIGGTGSISLIPGTSIKDFLITTHAWDAIDLTRYENDAMSFIPNQLCYYPLKSIPKYTSDVYLIKDESI